MLKTYDVVTARQTILRRDDWLERPLPAALQEGMRNIFGEPLTAEAAVDRIRRDVRRRGDSALRAWTERIDSVTLADIAVSPAEIEEAVGTVPRQLVEALELAASRIRAFHKFQPLPNWQTEVMGGVLGQRATPLARVGVYVPGGTAPLPSSLLMSAIPAQVAGVRDIVVMTPPGRDGAIAPVILAAAQVAGVKQIYRGGGAQAIAALAYGTETVPRVDKIVGPGNLFVTLAKRQVYGSVGIDGLYGPTETVVIADDSARPAWVAADLLAQAEHDVLATAILLTPSAALAEAVETEVARQIEALSRAEIIAASLEAQGGIVITASLREAAALANDFAAEHLCLAVAEPEALSRMIDSAGGFFLGEHSFEVLGDYVAGPSHTMPTSGTARFASPLNVSDFVRINSIIALDAETAETLSHAAAVVAEAEQLTAHAAAARIRLTEGKTAPRRTAPEGSEAEE